MVCVTFLQTNPPPEVPLCPSFAKRNLAFLLGFRLNAYPQDTPWIFLNADSVRSYLSHESSAEKGRGVVGGQTEAFRRYYQQRRTCALLVSFDQHTNRDHTCGVLIHLLRQPTSRVPTSKSVLLYQTRTTHVSQEAHRADSITYTIAVDKISNSQVKQATKQQTAD